MAYVRALDEGPIIFGKIRLINAILLFCLPFAILFHLMLWRDMYGSIEVLADIDYNNLAKKG